MMLVGLALMSGAVLVSGCSEAYLQERQIKKDVMERLVDPDSAKFDAIYQGKTEKHWCGMVNAKNRMGGYAGARPFVYKKVTDDFGLVTLVDEAPEDYEFRSLIDSSSFEREYKVLASKCRSIKEWNEVCGTRQMESHELCEPMTDPEDKEFIKKLHAKYRENR